MNTRRQLKVKLANINWQINARQRIQKLMLRQYEFLNSYPTMPDDNTYYQIIRMVQASYSLWRSAFLTDVSSDPGVILLKLKNFLEKILTTNTTGFPNELNNNDLAVAYYNTNARYRIERQYMWDPELLLHSEFQKLESLKRTFHPRQDEVWDICFDALSKWFDKLEARITIRDREKQRTQCPKPSPTVRGNRRSPPT
jgi:hypothetical protein